MQYLERGKVGREPAERIGLGRAIRPLRRDGFALVVSGGGFAARPLACEGLN
jgi:hypothetical protein